MYCLAQKKDNNAGIIKPPRLAKQKAPSSLQQLPGLQLRDENAQAINNRPKRKIAGEKVQEEKAMEIDPPKVSIVD